MTNTIKPETMWAIYNPSIGFYVGAQFTKSEAINAHTRDKGETWEECRAKGDRAVKVILTPAGLKADE